MIIRWIGPAFALLSLLVLVAGIYWQATQNATPSIPGSANIKLATLSEKPFTGTSLPAQTERKLVNVFASWCTPCIAELPYLAQLREATGLPLIGIAWNDHEAKLRPWLKQHGNPFDVIYLDSKGLLLGNTEISGLPETLLVDEQNRLLERHKGPITPANFADTVALFTPVSK